MATYLVTGGAGFIGSNFVLHVLANHDDARVVNLDKLTYAGNLENLAQVQDDPRYNFVQADICDAPAVAEVFERFQPDYVVNFAAESHVDRSILDPASFVRTNVEGAVTMLSCALAAWDSGDGAFGDHRFLQVSTDEVYGSLPLDQPQALFNEKTSLAARSPYSASKASADHFAQAYFSTYGMPVLVTRCSNNYGPFQFPEKLIPLMLQCALEHRPMPVYGDGLNVRDWLYVEDHCRAIDAVLERGVPGQAYNVGGRNERANIDIVRQIVAYVRDNVDSSVDESLITHVTDRKGHDRRYAIDPTKIGRELGWEPETPFEQGLGMTLDWYMDHRDWMAHVVNGTYRSYYAQMYDGREILDK